MHSRPVAEHVLTIDPGQNGQPLSFPPFSRRLAEAAFWVRTTPVPSPFAVEDFRDALCAYVHELRAAGIPRDQVARAIWPALTGIASARVVSKALTWCLDAYDKAT
jgi:hypothetical protein